MEPKRATHAAAVLITALGQAYDQRSWHGTNLRGALRGVKAADALWRPAPERHCIWEVAMHCAYWKYAVHRRITGRVQRGSFPLAPSNWPRVPNSATDREWRAAIALLDEMHARVLAASAACSGTDLSRRSGEWTVGDTVLGIASHDLYHAGQIQLLKRLRTTA